MGLLAKVSGKERIAFPDIGPLILDYLSKEGLTNYEELAKINPYDSKLRFLGEKLVAWVNQARNMLAEEIIRDVVVNDDIFVTCAKVYDEDVTEKCVLTRLGMYHLYLQVNRVELPDALEFEFSLKPEHEKYAIGPWLEYKQNARTYRSILARTEEAPIARPLRPLEYGGLLSIFGRTLLDVGQVRLAKELLLHLLFAEKLHCLIIGEPSSPAKSSLAFLLARFPARHVRHFCGDKDGAEVLSEKVAAARPDVIIVERPELATGSERGVLHQIMAEQSITIPSRDGLTTHPVTANVYAYTYPAGGEWKSLSKASTKSQIAVPTDILKDFHCVLLAEAYTVDELQKISRALNTLTSPSEDEVNTLRSCLQAAREFHPASSPIPEAAIALLTALHEQRKRIGIPITPQIQRGILEMAKARARMRMREMISGMDFDAAIQLMKASLITCGFREKRKRR